MRLLLRGRRTLDALRQIALKLYAIHHNLSPRTASGSIIFWPFRLCSREGALAISSELCATATCYFRSSTRQSLRSRCARILPHRAVRRSYDNPEVVRQPLFAIASDQLNPSVAHRELQAPF